MGRYRLSFPTPAVVLLLATLQHAVASSSASASSSAFLLTKQSPCAAARATIRTIQTPHYYVPGQASYLLLRTTRTRLHGVEVWLRNPRSSRQSKVRPPRPTNCAPTTGPTAPSRAFTATRTTGTLAAADLATTALSSLSPRTAFTWIFAALFGYWMDQKVVQNSGILVTLTISALVCQPSSQLSCWCWNTFLPASLALLILSLKNDEVKEEQGQNSPYDNHPQNSFHNATAVTPTIAQTRRMATPTLATVSDTPSAWSEDDSKSIARAIRRLPVPFLLATLGSVVGGIFTFLLCCYTSSSLTSSVVAGKSSCLFLPPNQARIAVSCLTASFIGGSVNFFATANFIMAETGSSSSTTALLSSLATADVVVMAVYFALLSAALTSKTLKGWFSHSKLSNHGRSHDSSSSTADHHDGHEITKPYNLTVREENKRQESPTKQNEESKNIQPTPAAATNTKTAMNIPDKIQASMVAFTTALIIVRFATWVEGRLSTKIPGLACAVITVLTPWIQHYQRSSPWLPMRWKQWYRDQVPTVARPLSQILFLFLFVSLGSSFGSSSASSSSSLAASTEAVAGATGSHARQVAWLQSGSGYVVVSLLPILIHCFVTLSGSWLWLTLRMSGGILGSGRGLGRSHNDKNDKTSNQHHPKHNDWITLEDVLVASNAAIGGPATAAAFCGRIIPRSDESSTTSSSSSSSWLKGLTYAATVWGVVGYAIGTTIGVITYRLLGWVMKITVASEGA